MKIVKGLITGVFITAMAACTGNKSGQHAGDSTAVSVEVKQGAPLTTADWSCYNVLTEKVCIPKTWPIVKQNQFLFLADLTAISKGAYFVVLKFDKKITNYTTNSYLKKIYTELKTDPDKSLAGYDAVKISYPDKEMVSGQYHTVTTNGLFVTYSTVFERGNDLYEIALKIRQTDAKQVEDRYKEIIFNIYSKGKPLFTAKDKIQNVEKIDLAKL